MKKLLLTLAIMLSCMSAMAQWSADPAENNRITSLDQRIYSSQFAVNKDGITFIHFNGPNSNIQTAPQESRSINNYEGGIYGEGDGSTITFLQILDQAGNKLFPEQGKVISAERTKGYTMVNNILMTDNEGNALLAVSDCRYASVESTDLSYTIYKVSPTGEMLWGEDGFNLEKGQTNETEACFNMVQRADGNYVFAWVKNHGNQLCIQLECVSKDGEFLWEESLYLREDDVRYNYPYLVDAGNNQVILVYAKGTNQDIMARKIDFDGKFVWPEDTRIYRGGFPAIPLHTILKVIPDPNGGVFVGWYDDRYMSNSESTYVSYVDSNGNLAFSAGIDGQPVGITENIRKFSPEMYYDYDEAEKQGYLYVIWRETSAGQDWQGIKIQKVAMTGELMWDSKGIDVLPLKDDKSVGYLSIQGTGDGDVAVFYMCSYSYTEVGAYVARINGKDGSHVWDNEYVTISTTDGTKGSLTSSPLINGDHWLTMWSDGRIASEEDENDSKLYMQCINIDGTLGAPLAIDAIEANQDFSLEASTMDGNITFNINSRKAGWANLSIYSVSGQKVAVPFNGQLESDIKNIIWNTEALAAGVYIATLTAPEGNKSIQIIVK